MTSRVGEGEAAHWRAGDTEQQEILSINLQSFHLFYFDGL